MANIAYWSESQYNSFMKNLIEPKKRKPPAERREEIVAAASRLAVAEGLESLTLRRVAEELGVVPGLVNHYFPVAEDLVAAAFGFAAAAERESVLRGIDPLAPPLAQMRYIIARLLADSADATSLLWLDAWQATRNRPVLRAEVAAQMLGWQDGMISVIRRGVAAGVFGVSEPRRTAVRIMALIDGFSVQAAMRSQIVYDAVRDLVFETIARELGLPPGALRP
jgi:AcrR family transcriptional regulator